VRADGRDAVWEAYIGKSMVYPVPQYPQPVVMRPRAFPRRAGQRGVAVRTIGRFTYDDVFLVGYRWEPGAVLTLTLTPAPKRSASDYPYSPKPPPRVCSAQPGTLEQRGQRILERGTRERPPGHRVGDEDERTAMQLSDTPLRGLEVALPVLAAPMAGGPSTPQLVAAAGLAGSLGFLAGGYKKAAQLAEEISETRRNVARFGVNLFAPSPFRIDRGAYLRYADKLRPLAERYQVDLPAEPIEDDDDWNAKLDVLSRDPVPVVSFTFAIPPTAVIDKLQALGTIVIQTVTAPTEAAAAADAGVDILAVQGYSAGGHSATLRPDRLPDAIPIAALIAQVSQVGNLPLIAAGGLSTADEVDEVLGSGAIAAMAGTALLQSPDAATSKVHRAALGQASRGPTVLTRAFTGRLARALPNAFIDRFGATAPIGYPAVHHLTSPIRKAASAAGDLETVHLWAGTGYQRATAEPAGDILRRLSSKY
jgi:nitronate monooxygenase